ncbi:alpha/beta hydrolase [Lactococcus lactis]|uniref:alpha/beta hydrolase n=1 Tax=Lactococcus lactis TaxID=1358 RepID=UPI00223BE1F1|nr:alpha/beta hydrolase [Lactococcus lactis]
MKTFNYGKDELQALDLYQPKEWNGKTLVLIHGGGWWQGDKGKEKEVATGLAAEGYQVAALNYRLATQAKIFFQPKMRTLKLPTLGFLKISQISRLITSLLLVAQQVDI